MKSWQEVALDLGVLAAATVLTALKVVTPEMFLLIVGPLVGAHVAKRGEAAKGKGKPGDSSVPPASASAVMALVIGAASLLSRHRG